jgi:hypothetical protein
MREEFRQQVCRLCFARRVIISMCFAILVWMVLAGCLSAGAQSSAGPNPQTALESSLNSLPDAPEPQSQNPSAPAYSDSVTLRETPLNILKDQAAIWTSPARIHESDLKWIVPLGLATTVAITADHQAMSSEVSHNPKFNHDNVLASDVFTGGLVAAPVALFGMGQFQGDAHSREAGILGGEALVDGVVVEQGLKLMFWRERPLVDGAKGKFFQSSVGVDSSFPSSHSVLSWSSAAVLAAEYPTWWKQLGIYSLATGVSVTRVLGQEHFPSDVLVGSAAGWLVGHYVYRKRHKYVQPTY